MTSHNRRVIRHRSIHCFGAGESAIEALLPDLIRRGRVPTVGITASKATITLRITAEGPTPEACLEAMAPTAETIYQCLGDLVFGEDGDTLQDVVIRILAERGQTLATVECGSGGTLAQWLSGADPTGSTFRGGMVLRDPTTSEGLTGVPWKRGAADSPQSSSDLQALAILCRQFFQTDYALAVGPFPQPDAALDGPPPVPLAVATPSAVHGHTTPYAGHPDILLARTVKEALNLLRLTLLREPAAPPGSVSQD